VGESARARHEQQVCQMDRDRDSDREREKERQRERGGETDLSSSAVSPRVRGSTLHPAVKPTLFVASALPVNGEPEESECERARAAGEEGRGERRGERQAERGGGREISDRSHARQARSGFEV